MRMVSPLRRVTDDLLRPEVPARVREPIEFLAALGDAEGIRCYFERTGIQGRRAAPWADPVARFVRSWPGVHARLGGVGVCEHDRGQQVVGASFVAGVRVRAQVRQVVVSGADLSGGGG